MARRIRLNVSGKGGSTAAGPKPLRVRKVRRGTSDAAKLAASELEATAPLAPEMDRGVISRQPTTGEVDRARRQQAAPVQGSVDTQVSEISKSASKRRPVRIKRR